MHLKNTFRSLAIVPLLALQAPLIKAADAAGLHLARTMTLLESATPAQRTPVNILFYGQSIVGQGYADRAILKDLRARYPDAAITYANTAIGGYQAPTLRRTAWQDMYNRNPDLVVFHVYGGENGELEEIFQGMKEHLTADVLVWTHHVDSTPDEANGVREKGSALIKTLAAKYGYEVADVRAAWKEHLAAGHLSPQDLTKDAIHLNDRGGALLGHALVQCFVSNPSASADWKRRVHTLSLATPHSGITYPEGAWKVENGGLVSAGVQPLRIAFTGNRVDLVGLGDTGGSAKILLDGKTPSTLHDTLAADRSTKSPGAWWPAVTRVTLGAAAVPQDYELRFHDVAPDGSAYAFDVIGSVSGDEGGGRRGQAFTAKSGGFSLGPWDFALGNVKSILGKELPSAFTVKWSVFSMSKDTWVSPSRLRAGEVPQQTVVRCWTDGPHVLEIIPAGDGPVGIRDVMIFSPSGHAAP